jgi:16S rRNA processing protein RimM
MLLVGVVARTQGNKGEVIVNATTDFPEQRFAAGAELWCRRRDGAIDRVAVRASRVHLGRPVLALEGVTSIGEAEAFAGAELRVPAAAQQPLPAHVYYVHELVGCAVWTDTGEPVGEVIAVDGDGGATRLVIKGPRGEVLVPFVQEFCTVDRDGRRIVVAPPEGLLDVNGGWRA